MQAEDLPFLKELMSSENENHVKAGILPSLSVLRDLSNIFPKKDLSDLLKAISGISTMDSHFFLCDLDNQIVSSKD